MRTTLRIFVLALGCSAFVAASFAGAQPPASELRNGPVPCRNKEGEQVVVVHEKDRKATVAHGEVLIVKLPAKLGTGYGWQVAKNEKSRLKIDGEPKVEDIPAEDQKNVKLSGTQYQVFRFLPGEAGQDELVMEYRRPFDAAEKPPKRDFKLDVTVCKCRD
jgi:predicted secreted protein